MRTREPPFRRWPPRCHVISHKSRHIMCLYVASSPPHKRKSGLITLQIVWFSCTTVQVCIYSFSYLYRNPCQSCVCPKNYVNPYITLIDVLTKAFFFISTFYYFLSGRWAVYIFLLPLDKRVHCSSYCCAEQKNNGKTNKRATSSGVLWVLHFWF